MSSLDDKRLDLETLFRLPAGTEKGRSAERDATRRALISALPVHPLRNGHVLSALHDAAR